MRLVRGVTWLVVRQHRTALWALLTGSALLAGYFLLGRYGAADAVAQQLAGCTRPAAEHSQSCADVLTDFQQQHQYPLRQPLQALALLPLVLGVFLGGPLFAPELESGTYRTALSQSVTRTRWFLAKLAVPVALTVLVSGLVTASATWWWHEVAGPLGSRFPWHGWMPYDAIGPPAVAKALLMLMVGITLSLVLRRTVAAMGATLALGAALLFALEQVRSSLWPTVVTQRQGTDGSAWLGDSWLLGDGLVKSTGQRVGNLPQRFRAEDYRQCLAQQGITGQWAEHRPRAHLWPLQWTESFLCLALAVILGLVCFWCTRRRLT
ncbi:ABC transporter permease subunit [Streptomyces sp. AP-93]|uniref:ABC transporter permease subunit n=1 Tax=Streptomyces sp. AP-93 TaxID=2929048 RepID=UPI001FB03A67|nr:ABC transporter permease subunit [Streptomyces sp. AP-93]MCJ0874311.1 ABC transporter permease subunit [Streptomyces sp. AP-93]